MPTISVDDFDTDDDGNPMPDAPAGTPLGLWIHRCEGIPKRVHRSQMVLVSGGACSTCGALRPLPAQTSPTVTEGPTP